MVDRNSGFCLIVALCAWLTWFILLPNNLAWAQEKVYLSKPITFIINFPPGSSADLPLRVVHAALQNALGVPVVLENKVGSAGALGADFVAKAKPHGYTLLGAGNAALTIVPIINSSITYKYTDFTPIFLYSQDYSSITALPSPNYKNLDKFFTYAKKNPGKLNCGDAGMGSVGHFSLEFFKQVFGLDIVPVHFTGTGPVKNAIMGGHVHLASTGLGAFVPLIKSKEVTLLVTGAPKRLQDFPDVPTLKDKGFPKAALNIWSGVFAHAKTPKNVVDKSEYEPAPLILALVLGRMAEESLRQSLVLSRGDLAVFIQSPISCGALIIAFLVMSSSLWIAGLKRLGRFIPLPSTK